MIKPTKKTEKIKIIAGEKKIKDDKTTKKVEAKVVSK